MKVIEIKSYLNGWNDSIDKVLELTKGKIDTELEGEIEELKKYD